MTGLVTSGSDLFISTSAKWPCEWDAEKFLFLASDKWKSYGAVYRMTTPGHVSATTNWTEGPTTFEFTIRGTEVAIAQDGTQLVIAVLTGPLAEGVSARSELKLEKWGDGIYGRFRGAAIDGTIQGP